MRTFLVERYVAGVDAEGLAAIADALRESCLQLRRQGVCVWWLGSTAVEEDEAVFCSFGAESIEAVDAANRRARLAWERVVPALRAQ